MKVFSLLLFSLVLACSQSKGSDKYASEEGNLRYEVAESEEYISEKSENSDIQVENEDLQEQKIIKTARLVFETSDPEKTHQKILQLTKQYKGFIQSDNSGKGYNRIFKNIVLRVPTEHFQDVVNGVSEGIEFFDEKTISRKDVSEEFVDLQARLKAKKQLEERYLELLKKAKNVKEMLEIERELSKIREEIEAKEGRLKYLQDKVSLSTVHIEFYKTTEIKRMTVSYGQKIKNALQGGWNGISVFFLGILYLWPLFILAFVMIFFIRRYLKKKKKNKIKTNS